MTDADDNPHAAYLAYMHAYRAMLKANREAQKAATRPTRSPKLAAKAEPEAKTDGRAKITEDDVRSIRRRHAAGENRNVLAKAFGITPRSVNLICARKKWARVI